MIRAPTAIAVFTIRSLAPLTICVYGSPELGRGIWINCSYGAAGAWYTTSIDADTPALRDAARKTSVVQLV